MKTKTINLYSLNELSPEAKESAHRDFVENNDYFFLSDDMNQRLHELLEENGIEDLNDTSKPGTKPTPVLYSLGHSQGDGAMFEGHFLWEGQYITIEHKGNYYHSNSKEITFNDFVGEDKEQEEEKLAEEFNALYKSICKQLEDYGYSEIDHQNSVEYFEETCELNDWTFLSNGKMEND